MRCKKHGCVQLTLPLKIKEKPIKKYPFSKWFRKFVDHCNKLYSKYSEMDGRYCCGYHWCCDECDMRLCNGCADCARTMVEIYRSYGLEVNTNDRDFEKFEETVRKLYERDKK